MILEGVEKWYQKEKTRGGMGFLELIWEHIRAQSGLADTPKEKLKNNWHFMVLEYNTDRHALASTGAAGQDT